MSNRVGLCKRKFHDAMCPPECVPSFNRYTWIIGEPDIGEETWIGAFCVIDGSGKLAIGKLCSISSGVHIYTHDSVRWSIQGLPKDKTNYSHIDRAPVTIGDNVYIGANSIITKGVTIGHHSIIGALTLVNKSIPPFSIGVGVPVAVVGDVRKSQYWKKRGKVVHQTPILR